MTNKEYNAKTNRALQKLNEHGAILDDRFNDELLTYYIYSHNSESETRQTIINAWNEAIKKKIDRANNIDKLINKI